MEFYCQKKKDTGKYRHFFNNPIGVAMCGVKKDDIVKVKITDDGEDNQEYWAYKDFEKNTFAFIYESEVQVKICSPDFFKSKIKEGRGRIVQVKVEEIE